MSFDPPPDFSHTPLDPRHFDQPRWLHPSSLAFDFASSVKSHIVPAVFAVFSAAQWGIFGLWIAFAVFGITMAVAAFRYLTLRYQLLHDELIIDQGWIFKKHRTIPVSRIQNIDLVQNLFHRLFRVAEVRIETASGTEAEAKLRVLTLHDVNQLREQIFRHRRAPSQPSSLSNDPTLSHDTNLSNDALHPIPSPWPHSPTPQTLLKIPLRDLFYAGLLSDRGWFIVAVAVGLFWQFEPWERGNIRKNMESWWNWAFGNVLNQGWSSIWLLIPAGLLAIVLLKVFSIVWHILRFHGYHLQRVGEDLRIECGLLTKLSATIPRPRIQFISIHRSWLARKFHLAAIRIETASTTKGDENATVSVSRRWFVPILHESQIPSLLAELRPGLQWTEADFDWKPLAPKASQRMRRLGATFSIIAFAAIVWWNWIAALATLATLWLLTHRMAMRKAKSTKYARTPWGLVYRSGLLTRKCSLTFFDKIQSVKVSHSPFDRRWKMATLSVDTAAAGTADHRIDIELLDHQFAFDEQSAIAKSASLIALS